MTTDATDHVSLVSDYIQTRFPATRGVIDASSGLLEAGHVDSLGILDIVEFLEERFEIAIEDDDLLADNFGSVNDIVGFLAAKLGGAGSP